MAPTFSRQFVCTLIESPLVLLGLYYLSSTLFHSALATVSELHGYIIANLFPPNLSLRSLGQCAVIHMDSKLSYYYAEALARQHRDIQLIVQGEDCENLNQFTQHLQVKYGVAARVLTYSLVDSALLECVQNALEELTSIGVLVNQIPYKSQICPQTLLNDIEPISTPSPLLSAHITKVIARKMVAVGRGAIVIISDPSGGNLATCVYKDYFSRSLGRELSCLNVQDQSLVLSSAISGYTEESTVIVIRPRVLARHAVNTIGKAESSGYWWFVMQRFVASCFRPYWNNYVWNRPSFESQLSTEIMSIC